jgi:hypothetical protein
VSRADDDYVVFSQLTIVACSVGQASGLSSWQAGGLPYGER